MHVDFIRKFRSEIWFYASDYFQNISSRAYIMQDTVRNMGNGEIEDTWQRK
jgi:hypothetical protein